MQSAKGRHADPSDAGARFVDVTRKSTGQAMAHFEPTCVAASRPPQPPACQEAVWPRAAPPRDDVAAAAAVEAADAADTAADAAVCAASAALLQAYVRAALRSAACRVLRVPWPVSVRAAAPPCGVHEPPDRLSQPPLPPAPSASWRSRVTALAPPRGDPRRAMPRQREPIDRVACWRAWVDSGDPPHARSFARVPPGPRDAPSVRGRERAERRCACSDPPTLGRASATAVHRYAERVQVAVCRLLCRLSRSDPPERRMSRGRYRPPPERWLHQCRPGHKPPWRRHAVGPPGGARRERSCPMREDPWMR
jgi:hypothetical protein